MPGSEALITKPPGTIPVENIYFLLCYAWGYIEEKQSIKACSEEGKDFANFFAKILTVGIRKLLRRGLHQAYVERAEIRQALRGRINFQYSARKLLLNQAKALCEYDELEVDVLPNQILRSTVLHLLRSDFLEKPLREQLVSVYRDMEGVSCIRLSKSAFRRVQLSSNERHYKFMINLCEMAFDLSLPNEKSQNQAFNKLLSDEARMHAIFEKFIGNFYCLNQTDYAVKASGTIKWDVAETDEVSSALLPGMEYDILLENEDRALIIDAKYYKDALTGRFENSVKIRNSHLYQICSYVNNYRVQFTDKPIEGMLLYAAAQPLKAMYEISGSKISARNISLDQPWKDIESELLDLLN